jgi:hypothetical protein
MATNSNITISKGSLSVEIHTVDGTAENIKNTLKIIAGSGGTTEGNQSGGPKDTKVIDLLRIQESYHIEGYLTADDTYTAKQVKDNLRTIVKGAQTNGGEITMVYEDENITGYIEDITIKKIINDDVVGSGYSSKDSAEYRVTIEFVKGVSI